MEHKINPQLTKTLIFTAAPPALACLLYYLFLGHRSDYLGHYAAGYGGTLSALALLLAIIPRRLVSWVPLLIVGVTIGCIGAGTIAEATVFCLAKFDEVDYCNQNLGALLAGLVLVPLLTDGKTMVVDGKPAEAALNMLVATGLFFLCLGVYFAVT